jgi:hypothetical protein
MQCASPFLGILGTNKHGWEQQTIREFQASSIQSASSLPALQGQAKISISQPSRRMMDDHVDGMALSIRARLNLNCVSTTPHQPSRLRPVLQHARDGEKPQMIHHLSSIPPFCPYVVSERTTLNPLREILRKGCRIISVLELPQRDAVRRRCNWCHGV